MNVCLFHLFHGEFAFFSNKASWKVLEGTLGYGENNTFWTIALGCVSEEGCFVAISTLSQPARISNYQLISN